MHTRTEMNALNFWIKRFSKFKVTVDNIYWKLLFEGRGIQYSMSHMKLMVLDLQIDDN